MSLDMCSQLRYMHVSDTDNVQGKVLFWLVFIGVGVVNLNQGQ